MERIEESLPLGLSYNQFKSAYSQTRRGAPNSEVSSAWTRYKTRVIASPKPSIVSPRRSPLRKPSSKSKSPPRMNLALLPPDVKRYLGMSVPSIAPKLQRLSRAFKETSKAGILQLCDSAISIMEVSNMLDRRWRRARAVPAPARGSEEEDVWMKMGVYLTPNAVSRMESKWSSTLSIRMRWQGVILEMGDTTSLALYHTLTWPYIRQRILDAYVELWTEWRDLTRSLQPGQYVLAIDRLSLYDILGHRTQCMEADPNYAVDTTNGILRSLADSIRDVVVAAESEHRPEAYLTLVEHQQMNLWLNAPLYGQVGHQSLNEVLSNVEYPPVEHRYDEGGPSKPCIDELTSEMLLTYLNARQEPQWFGFRDGEWKVTSVINDTTKRSVWIQWTTHHLVPAHSKELGGAVIVQKYVFLTKKGPEKGVEKASELTTQEVVENYMDEGLAILSWRHLRLVLTMNESCMEKDRLYNEKKSKQLLLGMLESVLASLELNMEDIKNMEYFKRYDGEDTLTLDAYNKLATLWFFAQHALYRTDSTSDARNSEPKTTEVYVRYHRMIEWVGAMLTMLY